MLIPRGTKPISCVAFRFWHAPARVVGLASCLVWAVHCSHAKYGKSQSGSAKRVPRLQQGRFCQAQRGCGVRPLTSQPIFARVRLHALHQRA